eukprot:5514581-Pyramimonas_sp.AAC.1
MLQKGSPMRLSWPVIAADLLCSAQKAVNLPLLTTWPSDLQFLPNRGLLNVGPGELRASLFPTR